ncbi:MAG: hypothetical protein F4069_04620 [Rhodothermaceae bacterium]|nr:hypothetical protein [Rhodothermaceae bacterium]MYG69422.1 hypothetical protein [Rhodothermaceae bacterium]MYJ44598.1 hypothetical protein [Rhodothermaceae bacterium]
MVELYKWYEEDEDEDRQYAIAIVINEDVLFARCCYVNDGYLRLMSPNFGQLYKFSPYIFENMEGPFRITMAEIRKEYGPIMTDDEIRQVNQGLIPHPKKEE